MVGRSAALEALHRKLQEPGNHQGTGIGADQEDPPQEITLPVPAQVAKKNGQLFDDAPRKQDVLFAFRPRMPAWRSGITVHTQFSF